MRVIVINGPMGVGKTTVGKYIADANAGTAFEDAFETNDMNVQQIAEAIMKQS